MHPKSEKTEPAVILRPFAAADLEIVAAIYTASIHTLAAPFYSPAQITAWAPPVPDLARWTKRLAPLQTIVADAAGALAGFTSYTLAGYLDLLFVHPAFARRGVATRLYAQAESALRAKGVTAFTTDASLAARSFFERQGFRVEREENVECRGAYLRRFAMRKPLRKAAPRT